MLLVSPLEDSPPIHSKKGTVQSTMRCLVALLCCCALQQRPRALLSGKQRSAPLQFALRRPRPS